MRQFLWEIDKGLRRLDMFRNSAKDLTLKTVKEIGKPLTDPGPQINVLMEQFLISPVDMDPAGIVGKIDHLLDVRDAKFKEDVRRIAPGADSSQVMNLENLVEAYLGAAKAFAEGQPIGDGIGPLVASRLMKDKEKRKVEKDVVVAETMMEDRRVIALKAEGPGGNVGKPGDAIKTIIEENVGKVSMVVMVDAAVKFEGENSGEVSEGIGAAIGGIGTERYKIEQEATLHKIPVYAVIVKESIQEAITPMKKEIMRLERKLSR